MRIEGGIFLALLGEHLLDALLLFPERVDHGLLLALLSFEGGALALALAEQGILLSLDNAELVALGVDLLLLGLDHLALCALIGSILADEAQSAVHLREVLG